MNTLTLQRNVQFIYEEQLARIEMQAFGCEDLQRNPNNPWQFKVRLNGTDTDVLKRAAYIGTLGQHSHGLRSTHQAQVSRWRIQPHPVG